jgi:hypothetical protein
VHEILKTFKLISNKLSFLAQKLKNSVKPNIYECKICHEHHCEHDFPEEDDHMLQEMETVYSQSPAQAALSLRPPPQPRRLTAQEIAETISESQHHQANEQAANGTTERTHGNNDDENAGNNKEVNS